KFWKLITVTGLLIFAVIWGCTENPVDLEKNLFSSDIQGVLRDTVLYPVQDSTISQDVVVSTQLANRLLIGKLGNFETRIVLKFTNYDTIPRNAQINEAKIRFNAGEPIGPVTAPFQMMAYPVLNDWITNLDTINFDATALLGETSVSGAPEDSTLYLELNQQGVDKVNFWLDTANVDENYGFYLDFSGAAFIQKFTSINSGASQDPALIVRYTRPGDTLTINDTLMATVDSYIYSGEIPTEPGYNYAATLDIHQTLLQFDLEGFANDFPNGVVINSANLQMPVNRTYSLLDNFYGLFTLQVVRLRSGFNGDSVVVDSSIGLTASISQWSPDSSYIEVLNEADRVRLAQGMVQNQIRDTETEDGFLISFFDAVGSGSKIANEKEYFSYLAFYRANNPNPGLRPRLVLTYWSPPSSRF
ncbi:MAG: hypothetical protein WAN36_09785, partial [Calditrichia bacterium]